MDMASEEIEMENAALIPRPEITSNDHTGRNKSHWVVELEEELMKDVETSGPSNPVIFRVEKALSASDKQFYIPSLISVGPYHFERKELRSMEPSKIEAVRRMQRRIHGRTMQSIVETEIVAMDKNIREFYSKELPYSAIDLAWMVSRDSCFLFEFMLNNIRTRKGKQDFHNDCVVEGSYDEVFSSSRIDPIWAKIVYDLALFENQIPLSVLQLLLTIADTINDPETILSDFFEAVAHFDGNVVFHWGNKTPYEKEGTLHFLEVLYCRNVSWDFALYEREAYSVKDQRSLHFGWIKSISIRCCPRWIRGRGDEDQVRAFQVKLPSAAELNKKGVNLCALTPTNSEVENTDAGDIQCIRFEQKTSTLYLPQVYIDLFRHALLRNFIALEYTSQKYRPFPVTSYALFMDELVDSEEDVAVLRQANIIKNFFGSNKEAVECINDLTMRRQVIEGCKPIDDARVALDKYLRRKYKILWNEFKSTYFAKPWLVAGAAAATLLLLMTVLQVFCLFYTCGSRT